MRRILGGMMLYDVPVRTIDGEDTTLAPYKGKALLIVNVASKCGLTPQYEGLQVLYERLAPRGLEILGFPCNQFKGQEPGTAAEIKEFCSMTYGVSFPLFEKVEVVGEGRHPLFEILADAAVAEGAHGDIRWNFEKVLVSPTGELLRRFRTLVVPEDPGFVAEVEAALPD